MNFKVVRNVFFGGDNASKAIAAFGHRGNIIGEIFGVFMIADNDGALSGVIVFEELANNKADGDALEKEK